MNTPEVCLFDATSEISLEITDKIIFQGVDLTLGLGEGLRLANE